MLPGPAPINQNVELVFNNDEQEMLENMLLE
jgi:hypothetical protein